MPQTLHDWIKRDQVDQDERAGVTTDERERIKALQHENKDCGGLMKYELGERVFRPGGTRPPVKVLKAFIDQHRDTLGVESICMVLRIAPSGYRRRAWLLPGPICATKPP